MNDPRPEDSTAELGMGALFLRSGFGGVLMGLANLVPGISGGTMLLAAGVYPDFINAIAKVSTFRFTKRSILVLTGVVLAAALAIVLLAGTVKDLVVGHRWLMYSFFIGLTLGGVPLIWSMIRSRGAAVWAGVAIGFAVMVALVLAQGASSAAAGAPASGFMFFLVAGIAGASAMVLPGVSGGYLWLVLGVYVPILGAIDACKNLVSAGDWSGLWQPLSQTVAPVALGMVIGIVVVSNALNWALEHYAKLTLGALLGLLLGAIVGLWPFQHGVAPTAGDTLKGQTVAVSSDGVLKLEPTGKTLEPDDYPVAYFSPTVTQAAGALGLVLFGLGLTLGISRVTRER